MLMLIKSSFQVKYTNVIDVWIAIPVKVDYISTGLMCVVLKQNLNVCLHFASLDPKWNLIYESIWKEYINTKNISIAQQFSVLIFVKVESMRFIVKLIIFFMSVWNFKNFAGENYILYCTMYPTAMSSNMYSAWNVLSEKDWSVGHEHKLISQNFGFPIIRWKILKIPKKLIKFRSRSPAQIELIWKFYPWLCKKITLTELKNKESTKKFLLNDWRNRHNKIITYPTF